MLQIFMNIDAFGMAARDQRGSRRMHKMTPSSRYGVFAARYAQAGCVAVGVVLMSGAYGLAGAPQKPERVRAETGAPLNADLQLFCDNNKAAIGNARIVWQTRKLAELEGRIQKSLAELQRKKAEFENELRLRDEMLKHASESVASIYVKMRPDAAASQLAAMEDQAAASILAKIPPRSASAILNEMDVGKAARLTRVLSGSAPQSEKKS